MAMKKLLFALCLTGIALCAGAQTISFTGTDRSGRHVQLDRVVVTDRANGW